MDDADANSSRKRPRYDRSYVPPSFCDATATVSATQFAARRLPEIKALWAAIDGAKAPRPTEAFTAVTALQSGGRKTSVRHLRRRATSHTSRRPPRRQTSNSTPGNGDTHGTPFRNRRARRLVASRLQNEHTGWQHPQSISSTDGQPPNSDMNATHPDDRHETNAITAVSSVHWMMTHVWHAKRFHMESLWGWKVPLIHSNRGCAAALRLVQEKCLIQDATWCTQPLWFRIRPCSIDDFQTTLRRLIPNWTMATSDNSCSGEGMLHRLDCFPTGAVAPVEWIWTRGRALWDDAAISTRSEYHVYLFVHPSVAPFVLALLREAFVNNPIQGPHDSTPGGVACLKLRGSTAFACLRTSLQTVTVSQDSWRSDFDHAVTAFHGSCIALRLGSTDAATDTTTDTATDTATTWPCLLRCIRPRDPTLTRANGAACGVDVFCQALQAKSLFQALVLQGGACPIGMAEAAYMALECHPPMPVFPRDYPDTDEGVEYWCGNSTSAPEWHHVRTYWQGGGGRIAMSMEPSTVPPPLLAHDPVVVVRGDHGDPFRQALSTCARLAATTTTSTQTRRKRRPTRMIQPFVEAERLSEAEYGAHQNQCNSLLQALSLPAVVLCHVQVTGKGTLCAGTEIYQMGRDDAPIGFVTVGTFSVSRGRCHGVAVVQAARFLQAVAASREDQSSVLALNQRPELQLLVGFKNASTLHVAALSLLR